LKFEFGECVDPIGRFCISKPPFQSDAVRNPLKKSQSENHEKSGSKRSRIIRKEARLHDWIVYDPIEKKAKSMHSNRAICKQSSQCEKGPTTVNRRRRGLHWEKIVGKCDIQAIIAV